MAASRSRVRAAAMDAKKAAGWKEKQRGSGWSSCGGQSDAVLYRDYRASQTGQENRICRFPSDYDYGRDTSTKPNKHSEMLGHTMSHPRTPELHNNTPNRVTTQSFDATKSTRTCVSLGTLARERTPR
jgi:hypothetical protein